MQEIWNQLTKEIKNHEVVIIMAHRQIDFDALGSSLCMNEIIKSFGKESYLFLDQSVEHMDSATKKAFERVEHLGVKKLFPNNYKEFLGENPLLIILDTHKKDLLAYPPLLDQVKDVVIIDHHIKGSNYIKNTVLTYMNSGLSSVTEFMIHYARYLNKEMPPIISTIMLAGLSIDTNEYRMKTNASTYEASALLMEMGANNVEKLEFLRESKEEYLKRLDFVKKSDMVKKGVALCIMDENIVLPKDLAIISESLLQFDKVDVAYTIGRTSENTIGISARSIGTVNVEEVMTSLGGGGHYGEAACQLENETLEGAREKLLEKIR